MKSNNKNIIYSTKPDFFHKFRDDEDADPEQEAYQLIVHVDKKNRSHKAVTIIDGYLGSEKGLKEIEKMLKSKCGVGGSSKDGQIIIQGEHAEKVIRLLHETGYKAKLKKR